MDNPKLDIEFATIGIILGLYFAHFADSIKSLLQHRKKIALDKRHTLMIFAVIACALQYMWAWDMQQKNEWVDIRNNDVYHNELINFIYLIVAASSFYIIGQFIHPVQVDIDSITYRKNLKFSASTYYEENLTTVYRMVIFYVVWTLFGNFFNPISYDTFLIQLLIKTALIALILTSIKLKFRYNWLDTLISLICFLMTVFYLWFKGHKDFLNNY